MGLEDSAAVAGHVLDNPEFRRCQRYERSRALHLASIYIDAKVPNLKKAGNFCWRCIICACAPEYGANLGRNDSRVRPKVETCMGAGREHVGDEVCFRAIVETDDGHAGAGELGDCERSRC